MDAMQYLERLAPPMAAGSVSTIPYLVPEEVGRRTRYDLFHKLYLGEHERVFFPGRPPRYQYVTANWLSILPATWSRLLFANFPEISAPAESDTGADDAISDLVADLDLSTLCRASAMQASWAGETIWKASFSKAQQRVVIRQVDPIQVTWEMDPDDPGTPIAASYWTIKTANDAEGHPKQFLVRERQALTPRRSTSTLFTRRATRVTRDERVRERELSFTYEAYQFLETTTSTGDRTVSSKAERVEIEAAFPEGGAPEDFILPLDILTLIYIPNRQTDGNWRGDSDYSRSLVSLQAEVNDRVSLNKHILDAHSKPTMVIPDDLITDGQVRVEDLDWLTAKQDGSGRVMYVEWSGEMGASFTQLTWLWDQFNALAGLSTTLSTSSSALTGRARELELVSPIAETKARRPGWEDAIQRAIYLAMLLEAANGLSKIKPVRRARVVWPTVLPDSRTETATVTATLLPIGAMSKEMAVRTNHPTWSDAEVNAELARIAEDDGSRLEQQSGAAEAQVRAQIELSDHQHALNLEAQENQARLQAGVRQAAPPRPA